MNKQHKWHKEIKAWADGAEIEYRVLGNENYTWNEDVYPGWCSDLFEFRIKSQPKTHYLYVYKHWNSKMIEVTAENKIDSDAVKNGHMIYVGKIKLEVDDEN